MPQPTPTVYVCDMVRDIQRLHADLLTDAARRQPIRDQLDRQAQRIHDGHRAGDRTVVAHITCWHPRLVGRPADEIMAAPFTTDDARQTIAREYGYTDWADVETHGTQPPDPKFESAVDALLRGDAATLRDLIARHPDLVHQRSDFGHRATLLHYAGSNGVETYRQVVPLNLADLVRLLIEAGADVNAVAGMYGGSTPLGLLLTSNHPRRAGVVDAAAAVLTAAGARE